MRLSAICAAIAVAGPAWATPAPSDVGPVTDAASARAYLDAVFTAHQCRVTEDQLIAIMQADGQSPRGLTGASASINPDKLMRHRRVFKELQDLRAQGAVCGDATDPSASIAKFGGCGA